MESSNTLDEYLQELSHVDYLEKKIEQQQLELDTVRSELERYQRIINCYKKPYYIILTGFCLIVSIHTRVCMYLSKLT